MDKTRSNGWCSEVGCSSGVGCSSEDGRNRGVQGDEFKWRGRKKSIEREKQCVQGRCRWCVGCREVGLSGEKKRMEGSDGMGLCSEGVVKMSAGRQCAGVGSWALQQRGLLGGVKRREEGNGGRERCW